MCGRYSLHANPEVIALMFGLSEVPAYQPRFNIAPTAQVLVVREGGAAMVKWGLVPRWAKDPAMGARMNNARAETVAVKPSFRSAFARRRCLIPADGYYEWRTLGGREHGRPRKQPYYIHRADGQGMAFAGIYELWRDAALPADHPADHGVGGVQPHRKGVAHVRLDGIQSLTG